jgi:hypothetical protein
MAKWSNLYSAGLKRQSNDQVSYNIESLVNTLNELERNEEHPLYSFIAAWNSRFVTLSGLDFSRVGDFRRLILTALKKWMCPEDASNGNYYRDLVRLQQDLNFPLRVFSLNYDRCVEQLATHNFRIETGFAGFGSKHVWDWERFEGSGPNPLPQIILYKLHGSINWKRNGTTKELYSVEQTESVESEQMEIIFGRDFKLEAADPYLFYAYEFRRYTLTASLIVVVGYGFGDSHINKMLTQGLRAHSNRRLLVVCKCNDGEQNEKAQQIVDKLDLGAAGRQQLIIHEGTARQFLETTVLTQILLEKIPPIPDAPF